MDRADPDLEPDLEPTSPLGPPRKPAPTQPDGTLGALEATLPHTHTPSGSTAKSLDLPSSTPAWLGRYEVVKELARGGMGVVYVARDPQLDREVAIKQCLSAQGIGSGAQDEEQQRFRREARAVASLQHPHIVSVFDVGEEGHSSYIVMDLIRGESLKDRLVREGPLSEREVARIGVKLAGALSYAHARSILHRDVKPHNVLVDADGEPHLTDFGLAKVADLRDFEAPAETPPVDLSQGASLTLTGQLLGTPAYMAPEQAGGEPLDERADVYGLGATLYALLTGSSPHPGKTLPIVLRAVLKEPLVPPTALRSDLDPGLDAIVSRCLAKAREERYPSCDAVGEALQTWLDRPAPPPAAELPSKRSAVPLAAGLILAAVGVFAFVLTRIATSDGPAALPTAAPIPRQGSSSPPTPTQPPTPSPTPTGPRLTLDESFAWAADPRSDWTQQPEFDPRREEYVLGRRSPDEFVRIVDPLDLKQARSISWAFNTSGGIELVHTPIRYLLGTGRLALVAESVYRARLLQADDGRRRNQLFSRPALPWIGAVLSDEWLAQVKSLAKDTWQLEALSTTWPPKNRTVTWTAKRWTTGGKPALRIGTRVLSVSEPEHPAQLYRLPRQQTQGMRAALVATMRPERGDLLAISPEDDRVAVRRAGRIEFLRLPDLTIVGAVPDARCEVHLASSAFSPDGRFFAWVDQTVHVVPVDDPTRPASVAQQPGWVAFFFHADRSLTVLTKAGVRRYELVP